MKNITCYSNANKNTPYVDLSSYDNEVNMLGYIQHKLYLAGDEQRRMEDEGGISLNREQNTKVNRYFKASQRIKKLLFALGYRPSKF